ncbi:MAG: hypothetical protein SOW34_09295 [Oliverpabstia sp.]|nr:hypothetical protein [Oliverpabstia sp.]
MKKMFYSLCFLLILPLLLTSCSQKKEDNSNQPQSQNSANAEENPTTPPSSDTAADDVSDQQEPSPAQNPSADGLTDSESQLQPQSISLLLSHESITKGDEKEVFCSGYYSTIQTGDSLYPKLQDALTDYNMDIRDSVQDTLDDCYEDCHEHSSSGNCSYYSGIYIQHEVYRSDTTIVSILCHESLYGCQENEDDCKELNIDPVTGKILHLNDVVQNMDSLSSALEEAICKQVPSGSLKDNLSHKLQDILEDDDLDDAAWNLGYQYLVFSFEAGSIAKETEGKLTIFLQDTDGGILKEKYQQLPDRYAYRIPTEIPFYADINGDGTTDSLIVHGDITEYDMIETIDVRVNDTSTTFESWSYDILPYLVHTEDNRNYLYLDTLHDNDYHSISVVDLNGTSPVYVDTIEGGLHNGIFCDPESFVIETRLDLLSTYSGIRSYALGDNGMPKVQQDAYEIVNNITLTAKKDLKLKDGKITAGSKCRLLRTDGKTWVEVELEDGSTRTIEVEHNGWPQMIQGEEAEEYFDDMIFAG